MSSISLGHSPRIHSQMNNARSGRLSPEEIISANIAATGDYVLFLNPGGKLKIVDVRERHVTPGTNPITLRIHKAGQVAAPSAATSGILIFNVASIATTTAANTWAKVGTGVTWAASPGNDAQGRAVSAQILYPGDTLVVNVPATVASIVLQVIGVWL